MDPFAMLDVDPLPALKTARSPSEQREALDDDPLEADDDHAPRGPSWLVVLLASYASALTIGFVWVLMSRRSLRESPEPVPQSPAPASAVADPGHRAGNSRPYTPPAPLAADRMTHLGKPIRLGGLEITPVEVTRGPVRLMRTTTSAEERDGGADALKLRLRLRNVSKDAVFAPLDEAFVRERDANVFDSFIERGDGQVIDMYPLSVLSEWSIAGQRFKELKPGETLDTQVVSAADAARRSSLEMTWRIRLRTGIEQTDVLGVRFRDSDIQAGS